MYVNRGLDEGVTDFRPDLMEEPSCNHAPDEDLHDTRAFRWFKVDHWRLL
jgi:hypothetical protein